MLTRSFLIKAAGIVLGVLLLAGGASASFQVTQPGKSIPKYREPLPTFVGTMITAGAFELTNGPGYVLHCHTLDHEDNEMMGPYIPVP